MQRERAQQLAAAMQLKKKTQKAKAARVRQREKALAQKVGADGALLTAARHPKAAGSVPVCTTMGTHAALPSYFSNSIYLTSYTFCDCNTIQYLSSYTLGWTLPTAHGK